MLQGFSLDISLGLSFHSRLLLALRSLSGVSEASRSLVKFCLAFIYGFSGVEFDWLIDSFGVVFVGEHEGGLKINFAFNGELYSLVIGPVGLGLLVECSPLALRSAEDVEVMLPVVGSFVKFVNHIFIKLLVCL